MMEWRVMRIQEGDYGCEERTEEERNRVIVTLENRDGQIRHGCEERTEEERNRVIVTLENRDGQIRQVMADDDWLYANGIDEGSIWTENMKGKTGEK